MYWQLSRYLGRYFKNFPFSHIKFGRQVATYNLYYNTSKQDRDGCCQCQPAQICKSDWFCACASAYSILQNRRRLDYWSLKHVVHEQYCDHFTFLLFEILNFSARRVYVLHLCYDGDAWLDHCSVGLGTWQIWKLKIIGSVVKF